MFRFLVKTPIKSGQTPVKDKEWQGSGDRGRAPLSTRTVLMNADKKAQTLPLSIEKVKAELNDQALSQCHLIARRTLSPLDIEEIWKSVTLNRLVPEKLLYIHIKEHCLNTMDDCFYVSG